jgi:hypothetical protein
MAVHEYASGMRVRTFPASPVGFNPLKADDSALIRHGFPSRGEWSPQLVDFWEKLMRHGQPTYIEPVFRKLDLPSLPPGARKTAPGITQASDHWSGAVVFPPAGERIVGVIGYWMVPNVFPVKKDGTEYYCWTWVGVDGWANPVVFQAGVQCNVGVSPAGALQLQCLAWWEWYPDPNPQQIMNVQVSPGDSVRVLLQATSSTTGTIYFSNVTTNVVVQPFHVTAPSGTSLTGSCAEWIAERPGRPPYTPLANFGGVTFNGSAASDATPIISPSDVGFPIDMVVLKDRILAAAACDPGGYVSVSRFFNSEP